MTVNFTSCYQTFQAGIDADDPRISSYVYAAPVARAGRSFITYTGCQELCGSGPERYDFQLTSDQILTWILPIIAVISQAPFESNKAGRNVLVLFRWLGSPLMSLYHVLWSIRTLGLCALMTDMSVDIDTPESTSDVQDTDTVDAHRINLLKDQFHDMRDSLFILGIMNQYTIRHVAVVGPARSRNGTQSGLIALLRIALFAQDLDLRPHCECPHHARNVQQARRALAAELRQARKKAVIPVLASTFWFSVALGLTLYDSFNEGFSLGLFLVWTPIFVLASMVDRNPTDSDKDISDLNELVGSVVRSLVDDTIFSNFSCIIKEKYHPENMVMTEKSIDDMLCNVRQLCHQLLAADVNLEHPRRCGGKHRRQDRTNNQQIAITSSAPIFHSFAGQGRVRWHTGIAHAICSDVEYTHAGRLPSDNGRYKPGRRNWLEDSGSAWA
ncbi:hypothetical protein BDZ85DRAFT_22322, partial [Elsinoe ampelina]